MADEYAQVSIIPAKVKLTFCRLPISWPENCRVQILAQFNTPPCGYTRSLQRLKCTSGSGGSPPVILHFRAVVGVSTSRKLVQGQSMSGEAKTG